MYFITENFNNIEYSVDMLRLKTYITYSTFTEIEFRFKTCWAKYVEKQYTSARAFNFFYNYVIEVEEGKSFYFGFLHNSEKRQEDERGTYNFTIEFNPNKLKDNPILLYLLDISNEWYIKSLDIACDLKVNILDIIYDKCRKRSINIISNGFDDKTYRIGKGNGKIKIYNKKNESNLEIPGDLTRVEISREYDDFPIKNMVLYKFEDCFPDLYLNNYLYTFSDYKNKTMLAILYAVQNGFPINDLTRDYKNKIKNMFEGGNQVKFDRKVATQVVNKVIYCYFMRRDRKNIVLFR